MATQAHTTSFDLSAIMRAAWSIFHLEGPAVRGSRLSREGRIAITFAAALRRAWANAKRAARPAAIVQPKPMTARETEIFSLEIIDNPNAAERARLRDLRIAA